MNGEWIKLFRVFVAVCCCVLVLTMAASGVFTVSENMSALLFGEAHETMSASFGDKSLTLEYGDKNMQIFESSVIMRAYSILKYVLPAPVNAAFLLLMPETAE